MMTQPSRLSREGFFMRPPKEFPPGTAARLNELLKQAGEVIEAGAFRRDYQELVGHKVAASTVYRLLARSGWRGCYLARQS